MSEKVIDEIFKIVNEDEYTDGWLSLRVTFDQYITEDNEVEFMDKICQLHQDFVNQELGHIVERNAGIEHLSGHTTTERWTDVKSGEICEEQLYAGDECQRHGHIHYRVALKPKITLAINQRKPDKDGRLPTVSSVVSSQFKKFWRNVKNEKCIDNLWFSLKNVKHQKLSTLLEKNNPDIFLAYPLKMFHRRPPKYKEFCERWSTWDTDKFKILSLSVQSKFEDEVAVAKKKKALLQTNKRSCWSERVETWIKARTNDYTPENIDAYILDLHVSVGRDHDVNDIVRCRNTFLNTNDLEYRKKFLKRCSDRM